MTLLAVMALHGVTPGACAGVPISGANGVRVSGQVTSWASWATGADKSEPHGTSWPAVVYRTPCVHRYGGGVVPVVYPGVRGVRVSSRGAHHTGVNECIYGVITKARQGQGQGQERCENGARTVPEPGHNSPPDHPTTRHPTTRYPTPATHNVPLVYCCSVPGYC